MKRFEKYKRILATLLVALMVIQQSSIMTLAEELTTDTQTVQEENTVTQESKPDADAPETSNHTEEQSGVTEAEENEDAASAEIQDPEQTTNGSAEQEETTASRQENAPETDGTEPSGTVDTENGVSSEAESNSEYIEEETAAQAAVLSVAPENEEGDGEAVKTEIRDVKQFLTGVTVKKSDGTIYDSNSELDRDGSIEVSFTFTEEEKGKQFPEDGKMTYQIPDVFHIESTDGSVSGNIDGKDTQIGTYTIDENGLMTFQLDPEYVKKYNILSASAHFKASFIKEKIEDNNKTTIDFGNSIKKEFTFKPEESVGVSKSSVVDVNDPTLFHYTIVVTAGSTGATNVTLTDYMSNLELVAGTLKKDGSLLDSSAIVGPENENYTIAIGNIAENGTVTITYDARIPSEKLETLNGEISAYNSVKGKSEKSKESTPSEVTNKYSYSLLSKKNVKIDTKNNTATWTITVNAGNGSGVKRSLEGYTVTDVLQNSDSNYKIDKSKNLLVSVDGGAPTGWDWNQVTVTGEDSGWFYTFGANSAHTYTFTYVTTIPSNDSYQDMTVVNNATLKKDKNEISVSESGTIGKRGLPDDAISKADGELVQDVTKGDKYVKWVITVKVPKTGYKDFYLKDEPSDSYVSEWVKQTLDVSGGLTSGEPAYNQVGISSSNANLDMTGWNVVAGSNNQSFELKKNGNAFDLPEAAEDYTITLVYYTKLAANAFAEKTKITNKATMYVEKVIKADTGSFDPSTVKNYTTQKIGSYADGKIKWTMKLNTGKTLWEDGSYSIVDDYGELQTLDVASIEVKAGPDNTNWLQELKKDTDYTITNDAENHTFSIIFGNLKALNTSKTWKDPNVILQIIYKTIPDNEIFVNGTATEIQNTLKLKKNDDVISNAEGKVTVTPQKQLKKEQTKEPNSVNGYGTSYKLTVNPDKKYLSGVTSGEASDYIITDSMAASMQMDLDSVKVIKNDTDELQKETDYTLVFDSKKNEFTITIPKADGDKYTITYDAYIKGPVGTDISYSNTANLKCGTNNYSDNVAEKKIKIQSSDASGGAYSYPLYMEKWDTEYTEQLQATFKLEEYDKATDSWTTVRETVITSNSGKTEVGIVHETTAATATLHTNTLYRLVETNEPSGYIKSAEPYYFLIAGTGAMDVPDNAPAYDTYVAVKVGTGNKYEIPDCIKLTNEKQGGDENKGQIKVTKEFSGVGSLPEGFKITNTYDASKEFTVENASGKGSAEDPYTWTLEDVPVGTEITFTETGYDVDGYVLKINGKATAEAGASESKATVEEGKTVTAAFVNAYSRKTGKVKVTKVFSGVGSLPEGFKITNTYDASKEFTVKNASGRGTAEDPYTWTLEDVPVGTEITFTETGYDVNGYVLKINGKATAEAGASESKATVEEGKTVTAAFVNAYDKTYVSVSKKAIAGTLELEGAKLQILDKDKKVVTLGSETLEWTSGDTVKEIKGLKAGETYYLHEESAPDGYTVAEDIAFTIDAKGTVKVENEAAPDGKITMKDAPTFAKISKVDAADGKSLEGAHIQILDPTGKVVDEWTTTKETHELTGLKTDATYTLRETLAPTGYDLAEDTTFTLNVDGSISADKEKTTTAVSEDGVLLVKDIKTVKTNASLSVTKRLTNIDGQILNAKDQTFYVALYADSDCTRRVSAVKALEFKNASSSTVIFENLKANTTYYVGECTKDGISYGVGELQDGSKYTVEFGSGNKVVVEKADGTKEVHFDNQFLNVPDGYSVEAYLSITKKVRDVENKAMTSNETFYAGIFADKDFTTLSNVVSENIIALKMDGASEVTVETMVPIIPGDSINLYVTEVDANGKPVKDSTDFAYDVEVTGGEIVLSDKQSNSSVTITNTVTVEEESESETETEVSSEKTTKKTTTAAKTGDNTPIGMFAGMLAASMTVVCVYVKRRRKNQK